MAAGLLILLTLLPPKASIRPAKDAEPVPVVACVCSGVLERDKCWLFVLTAVGADADANADNNVNVDVDADVNAVADADVDADADDVDSSVWVEACGCRVGSVGVLVLAALPWL